MALSRQQTDLLLADLENRVRQRADWPDHAVFYQVLDYDLQPILDTAADPEYVRAWTRAMLVRNGHAADPSYDVETAAWYGAISMHAHGVA